MSFKNTSIILLTLLGCLLSLTSHAQKSPEPAVWEQWVLDRHPDLNCPWLISAHKEKICHWPGEFVGKIVDEGILQLGQEFLIPIEQ